MTINIIESASNFAEISVVLPVNNVRGIEEPRNIFVCHLREIHYLSTVPVTSAQSNSEGSSCISYVNNEKVTDENNNIRIAAAAKET